MKIYHISKNYASCEVWTALDTGERFMRSSCTPQKGLGRAKRAEVITDYLKQNHGLRWSATPQQMEGK